MEIVVIGGGIVGSSAAYRAARGGARVTLIDRADQGQATAAGAGIIAPGTTLRADPGFEALLAACAEYYPQLLQELADDGETNTGYAVPGELFVAMTDEEGERLPEIQRIAEARRAEGTRGVGDIAALSSREAQELFPPLAETRGAIWVSGAARVDGRLMRDSLRRAAAKRGAAIVEGAAEPVVEGGRITEVQVDGRRIGADAVIVSGGAWSAALAQQLGFALPVYPQRGQILHLVVPDANTSAWPIITGFHSHYMLTFPPNRVVAGATREHESGFDYRMTAGGVREVLSEALRVAPGLADATVAEIRIGLRPASPDGRPILGQAPGLQNVYVATGHGPSGLQLGPYSGAAVADLVLGHDPGIDLTPFSPSRF